MQLNSRLGSGWAVRHSFGLLVATALAAWSRQPWIVALLGCASFLELCLSARRRWTAHGAFGVANAVTALRVALCAFVLLAFGRLPGPALGFVLLLVFALDGLDGFLARRAAQDSSFGAEFDMEADAFLVLVLALLGWLGGVLGAWVLSAGLLRYLYVLALFVMPARREQQPRSRFGRWAFSLLVSGLIAVWWLPEPWASALAAAGTAAVWLSFIRGFVFSYARLSV